MPVEVAKEAEYPSLNDLRRFKVLDLSYLVRVAVRP
jgi:hypothetical protein